MKSTCIYILCGLNQQPKLERTFRADVERVGDVAGQTHMQRAAEALVMWLCGWEGQYTVGVVELPTQWYHAALYPITRLLTHKACVDTWKKQKGFLNSDVLGHTFYPQWQTAFSPVSDTRHTHQCCIHDRGTFPWEPLTGQYTAGERLHNSGPHTTASLLSSHTPAQTYKQIQSEKHANNLPVTNKGRVRS